ncbi:MAG: pyridoxal phosphate-dependent aminotransferase [Bryobacterales bacterium]|nr:pyridoxal phosphate-dependent aminotransferase [Bryobacterales bacterium]
MSSVSMKESVREELSARGHSRRSFGRAAALLTAGASLPFYNEFALAQRAARVEPPADAVRISSNENPLGPSEKALEAIYAVAKNGGRYGAADTRAYVQLASSLDGVKPNYVTPYAGSSDPLYRSTVAFTSPERSFVMGDPGYEAGARAAEFIGAKVHRVPLRKDFSHDVQAMVKADPNAGIIYICNPNNPTGTMTSRADIEYVIANKPKGSILLLDEAYIHFSADAPGTDYVAQDKDVIVLRTFSKLYGMAGIRAGLAIGRPDLLAKLNNFGAGMLPVTGTAAALASLQEKDLIEKRRGINKNIREDLFSWMHKKGYKFVPSESCKFMLETGRPGREVWEGMMAKGVMIGRTWPAWPTHVRVSIGTQEEMNKFKAAIATVMG